jgi:hypothetical protein
MVIHIFYGEVGCFLVVSEEMKFYAKKIDAKIELTVRVTMLTQADTHCITTSAPRLLSTSSEDRSRYKY